MSTEFSKGKLEKRKAFQKPVANSKSTGVFKSSGQGNYGFIEGTDLYIRKENLNHALNRDVVEYIVLENVNFIDDKFKYEGQITAIIERYKTVFVGEIIHKEQANAFVLLDSPKLNKVVTTLSTKLPIGEKVAVELTYFDIEDLKGHIVKSLGHKGDTNIEIISVLEEHGISVNFPPEVDEEVKRISLDIEEHRKDTGRQDSTNIPFITIDPVDSKDFDDAVYVEKINDRYRLYVAIADVWSYLKKLPLADKEARERSTSIYYLQSVIPMIAEKLSNDFCSLVPGKERCAVALHIDIFENSKVDWNSLRIFPTIIKSKKRFSYSEVNEYFDKKKDLNSEDPKVKESLDRGFELYKILEKARVDRGYLSIEVPELKFDLDEKGFVTGLKEYRRGHAQVMIENFMILANESVARFCESNSIPAIYRTHEKPDINKMLNFIQEAKKVRFYISEEEATGSITQKTIAKWFEDNKDNPYYELISLFLLKNLQKAKYSINNLGHFGLNLSHYLHFTSPIRRYPDTTVHKMLWEYVFEKKPIPTVGGDDLYRDLSSIAAHSTNREIRATEVCREIETLKIIQYMNSMANTVFKAMVTSSSKTGSFVRVLDLHVEGYLKNRFPLTIGSLVLVKPIFNSREFKLIKIL